jgi:hypothetical protein
MRLTSGQCFIGENEIIKFLVGIYGVDENDIVHVNALVWLLGIDEPLKVEHIPISLNAFNENDLEVAESTSTCELDDVEGFVVWKKLFDKGEAGVYSLSVEEVLMMILENSGYLRKE